MILSGCLIYTSRLLLLKKNSRLSYASYVYKINVKFIPIILVDKTGVFFGNREIFDKKNDCVVCLADKATINSVSHGIYRMSVIAFFTIKKSLNLINVIIIQINRNGEGMDEVPANNERWIGEKIQDSRSARRME